VLATLSDSVAEPKQPPPAQPAQPAPQTPPAGGLGPRKFDN